MSGRVTMEPQGGPDPDVVLIPYGEEIPASHVYICIMVTDENEMRLYTKKHSFAEVSTRNHYPGPHSVTLIVNGTAVGTLDFEVLPIA